MSRRLTVRLETWPARARLSYLPRRQDGGPRRRPPRSPTAPIPAGARRFPTPVTTRRLRGRARRSRASAKTIESGIAREALQEALPPGAARNAARLRALGPGGEADRPAGLALAGLDEPQPCTTAVTLRPRYARQTWARPPPRIRCFPCSSSRSPAMATSIASVPSARTHTGARPDRGRERRLDRADAGGVPAGLRRPRGRDGGAAAAGGRRRRARRAGNSRSHSAPTRAVTRGRA